MKKITKKHLYLLAFIVFFTSVFAGCPDTEKSVYNVTARFQRKTLPAASTQVQTLSFIDTLEFAKRTDKVNMHVSDIDITGVRVSGDRVPPLTTFVSMTYFRKEGDIMSTGNGFAGNTGWLTNHVGEIAICTDALWIGSAPNEFGYNGTDSAVNIALTDDLSASLHPVYRESGASYLAKMTDGEQYIPWIHPEVPTGRAITVADINAPQKHVDMRSLTILLHTSLSTAISGAITAMPTFSWTLPAGINIPLVRAALGGPNRDGDFKLHFIPQLQSNENGAIGDNANQVMRAPGIGFYFEATIDIRDAVTNLISVGTIKIVVPAILMFQRTDANGDFQVELQPIADLSRGLGANSTGLDKIIVLATTPFGIASTSSAATIRTGVITALTGMATGAGGLGAFITSTIAFSSGFNKYKPNKQFASIDFDIVTVPNDCNNFQNPLCFKYKGLVPTQVQPEGTNSSMISTFILNRYR
jgi:hypothetical protein